MPQVDLIAKENIRAAYGVNKRIEGGYDAQLAAECRNGIFVGKQSGDVAVYRGIPFAKAPVGELRWKRPEPAADDKGVYEAYYNGKTPIQTEWPTEQASYYPQGEDCLYLNIWVNRACTDKNKTVMVFLHGGSYGWGGTADPLYDGANFVRANPDIVLAAVGYRTGMMGFVDLSYLEGGEDYPDAPNLGILDQIEGLRWIRDNIGAFGGDPDNVTIFGESAGGGTVSLLPLISEAKGLFRRVIAQSGSVALTFSKEECRDFTHRLMRETKAKSMKELMALSEDELMRVNEKLNLFNCFPLRDGKLIPLDPYAAYKSGATADVDMMIGTNADESNYWVGELDGILAFTMGIPVKFENDMRILSKADKARVKRFMDSLHGKRAWKMAEFYDEIMFRLPAVRQAEYHSFNGGRVYMYYWTEPSDIVYMGACHAVELAYVFGNTDETIFTGKPADKELSDTVMRMWANFARTGDPSVESFEWPRYNISTRETAVISKKPRAVKDVLSQQRKLLMPLLKYMMNGSYATLDYNVPFVRKAVGIACAVTAAAAGIIITAVASSKKPK